MSPNGVTRPQWVNSSPPGQNGPHFPDNILKCIFMNEKFCILIWISLKFVPKRPINNIPAYVQILAWRRPAGLDIRHLAYMPIGHMVLKIDVPCKNFQVPSQYLYKPCKAYVYCWENKYMPWLKKSLARALNHKSLCALGQDLHAPGMRARLNVNMVKPWPGDKPLSEPMMASLLTHIYVYTSLCLSELTNCGLGKRADILQTALSNFIFCISILIFLKSVSRGPILMGLIFHWNWH